jgi:hypothetical protein
MERLFAGSSDVPTPGDIFVLTAPAHLWREKTDLLECRNGAEKEQDPMMGERSKRVSLHGGTIVQVLNVEVDAIRVQVTEDGARAAVKCMFGDRTGMVGFVPVDLLRRRVSG